MDKEDLLNINGGGNKKDFKKILIYGAAVFLLFVIGVIAFAIYKNMKQTNNNESILPPQVKQEPLFKQVPIQNVKNNQNNVNENNTTKKASQNKVATNNIKQALLKNSNEKTTNVKTTKEIPISKEKPVQNVKKQTKNKVTKTHINYYIQVAALLKYKKPNEKFLKLIKKYGYNYRFYTTYIKRGQEKIKVTKILVGPFSDRKEAEKNLQKVREYITQNAFIFKVR